MEHKASSKGSGVGQEARATEHRTSSKGSSVGQEARAMEYRTSSKGNGGSGAKLVRQPPVLSSERQEHQFKVFPWSAAVCSAFVALDVVLFVGVFFTSIDMSGAHKHPGMDNLAVHSRNALLLLIQAGLLELFILVSSYSASAMASDDEACAHADGDTLALTRKTSKEPVKFSVLTKFNIVDSCLTILEYSCKSFTAFHFSVTDRVVWHRSVLAPSGARSVFLLRYFQWSVAVPVLILLSNRSFLNGKCSQWVALLRSLPGMLLSSCYILMTWLMEVTNNVHLRNLLIMVVYVSFIVVCVDQVMLSVSTPNVTARSLKLWMVAYQIFSFTLYAVLYLAAYFGFVDCTTEQMLYNYMDATVKVLGGCFIAMIRNYEGLRIIRHWWMEAVAVRKDFERIVKQARVPIFTLDVQGRVTSWNRSLATLTGLPQRRIQGMPIGNMLKKECREPMRRALIAASEDTSAASSLEIIFKKDPFSPDADDKEPALSAGSNVESGRGVIVVSMLVKTTKDGKVEGFVGIGHDITEICDLKAVQQQKGQLMAVVSHELRSPLHGMIGLVTMLEQKAGDSTVKRQLTMVRNSATRLLDLVTNIMTMTEADQRQRKGIVAQETKSDVNFVALAEEVTVMTMTAVNKAGAPLVSPDVQLLNRVPDLAEFPVVSGNPYKCTQLLYNLVTNACKFTARGSVAISARHNKEASMLELSVEDTGIGISTEAQDRIFRAFEQADGHAESSQNFKGCGLGLAVCQEIVTAHGGSIKVSSKVGQGSTFIVSLPCEDRFVERIKGEEALSAVVAKERGGPKAINGKEKAGAHDALLPVAWLPPEPHCKPLILSVDDDMINQEVVKNALNSEHDVVIAMDGKQALDHLARCMDEHERFPDVMLLDIQMPGLTGFDVLEEISKCQRYPRIPVIMVSAKSPFEVTALRCYGLGCTDFLMKPFHMGMLKAKVTVAMRFQSDLREQVRAVEALREVASERSREVASERSPENDPAAADEKRALEAEKRALEAERRLKQAEKERAAAKDEAKSAAMAVARERAQAKQQSERAEGLEKELALLRAQLSQSRTEAEAAAVAAKEAAADAFARGATGAGGGVPELEPSKLKKAQPPRWHGMGRTTFSSPRSSLTTPRVSCEDEKQPAERVPLLVGAGAGAGGTLVPWLYEQLADREQQIADLAGRLAAESSAKELIKRQLDWVTEAAKRARDLLL